MSEKRNFVGGHKTLADGSHVPITKDEAEQIWKAIEAAQAKREETMPTTADALSGMCNARQRLRELGWEESQYCPKDGSVFALIEVGSTGIFKGFYSGEWPDGYLNYHDCATRAGLGLMFKPLNDLTGDEREKLEECEADHIQFMERQFKAFPQMDQT